MNDPNFFDVIVIGAGAAGLMCALTAGRRGLRVLVVDHANRVGKKILMSGGGRCNFTNLGTTPGNFLSDNPHYCKSALARFTPTDFVRMVEAHGIAYHEKELGQLFCDESSKQIVAMLLKACADTGKVSIVTECKIGSVEHHDCRFIAVSNQGRFESANLVVASGGLSIPSMGASGFGYQLASQFGHRLLPTRAGLVPLMMTGSHLQVLEGLSGVSLPISARVGKVQFDNAMLVTHRGLSGPAILQISSYWQLGSVLKLDLLPRQDALEALTTAKRENGRMSLGTVLMLWFPKRFAQRLGESLGAERNLADLNKSELEKIAATLRQWPLPPSGNEGYRTAEVTLGGVDTRELSSSTMESKRVPGLYFIGEVVDVTGWLGGYNFQWAWASGHVAGESIPRIG